MFRLDRNRQGGGVIMYILKKYTVKVLSIVYDNLELFTVTVDNGCCKVCISLFYRPPSSPPDAFEVLIL